MAAVIVHLDSAANAVPDDASIPPIPHPYIKVTVWTTGEIVALRPNTVLISTPDISIIWKRIFR